MYWNAQGIKSKTEELGRFLNRTNIDVVCLCESFLKGRNRFSIDGYTCIRKDRTIGRLGGLLILIRNGLVFNEIISPHTHLVESMSIEITCNNKQLKIINTYLPGGTSDAQIQSHYRNDLVAMTNTNEAYFVVGDLNSKHSNWNCSSNNTAGIILDTFTTTNNVFVEFPASHTYCPMSTFKRPSTIDLLLTNHKINISSIETKSIFSSDHLPVIVKADMCVEFIRTLRYNYRYADWTKFRNIINSKLDTIMFSPMNNKAEVDVAINSLQNIIILAQEQAIPLAHNGGDGIFLDPHTKFLVQMRNVFRRRFLRYHDPLDNDICKKFRKLINSNIISLRNDRWEQKLKHCDVDHTGVFKIAKSLKRHSSYIPPLQGGALSNKDKAKLIAETFYNNHINPLKNKLKNHTKLVNHEVESFLSKPHPVAEETQFIDYKETVAAVKRLKNNKAPGSDQINAKLIKNLPNRATFLLTHIFNRCLLYSYFPEIWKSAKVFPLLKPNKPAHDPLSYRPISLLSILGKIFERLILKRINDHLDEHLIIPNEQFGFRKEHSTGLQILRIFKHVKLKLNAKLSTGFIAFDIEKAFDRVWHAGLLYKLKSNSFPPYLIKLLNSFLTNRTFKVGVGSATSDSFKIPFGVPQGSVLSPILYNIYTSDIPCPIDCSIASFADDTALYTSSRFYKTIKKRLENGSKVLSRYFSKWKIAVNNSKTKAIFFTKRRKKQKPKSRDRLCVSNAAISWDKSIKYLGCHLDPTLTLELHINKLIQKSIASLKCLYPLIHRRSTLSRRIKNHMYKLYFRPVLTYPSIVLSSIAKTHIKKLQTQQNKLLKILNSKPRDFRTSRLHHLAKVPLISDHLKNLLKKAENRAENCENELIAEMCPL